MDVVNVGYAAYVLETDVQRDLQNKNTNALEKVFDVSIDVAKNAEKFAVDNALADAGIAGMGETFGLSAVAAIGAIAVNDFIADHVAEEAKSLAHTVEKTGRKIKHFFGF